MNTVSLGFQWEKAAINQSFVSGWFFSSILGDLLSAFGTGMGDYRFVGTPSGAIKMYRSGWNYQLNLSTGKKQD